MIYLQTILRRRMHIVSYKLCYFTLAYAACMQRVENFTTNLKKDRHVKKEHQISEEHFEFFFSRRFAIDSKLRLEMFVLCSVSRRVLRSFAVEYVGFISHVAKAVLFV